MFCTVLFVHFLTVFQKDVFPCKLKAMTYTALEDKSMITSLLVTVLGLVGPDSSSNGLETNILAEGKGKREKIGRLA